MLKPVNLCGHRMQRLNPDWEPCMHELLFYTSRYASVAEHWLSQKAALPGFTLEGYRAQCLDHGQRRFIAMLMAYPLTRELARAVCWSVHQTAFQRAGCTDCDQRRCFTHCPRHARTSTGFPQAGLVPHDPFMNMASRLHLKVVQQGRVISVCFHCLATWLDCPNPAIRTNLQAALSLLGACGYHLHNRKIVI